MQLLLVASLAYCYSILSYLLEKKTTLTSLVYFYIVYVMYSTLVKSSIVSQAIFGSCHTLSPSSVLFNKLNQK